MALVTLPNTFINNTVADATEVNANFNALTNEVNGSLNASNLAATLTFASTDFVDLASITHNSTALMGLRLPQIGTSPSSPTSGEGFLGYDETNNTLEFYNGSAWRVVMDIVLTSLAQGDIIYYNGTNWVNLAPGTANHVLTTNGAAANPAWEAGSQATLTTQGDILYRNASGLARLGAGTSGYFLQTLGAGANPAWAQVAAAWEFVESLATTSGTSVTSATLPATSDLFMVVFEAVGLDAAGTVGFRPNSDSGGDKDHALAFLDESAATITWSNVVNQTSILVGHVGNNSAARKFSGVMWVTGNVTLNEFAFQMSVASQDQTTAGDSNVVLMGKWTPGTNQTITTLNFIAIGGGNFNAGKIHIYRSVPS